MRPAHPHSSIYDGDALVAEYDAGGAMTNRYVQGEGADDPLVLGIPAPPVGSQVAFLHRSNAAISLTVSNLIAGRQYAITGKAIRRPNFPFNPFTIGVNGANLATISPADNFAPFVSAPFTATASTMTIMFSPTRGRDAASGIDAIAVV